MREYIGLHKLREVGSSGIYCPKCSNYLKIVMNGFFHGEVLFCPKEELVFVITLRDMTQKVGKEFIDQSKDDIKLKEIKNKITLKNMGEFKYLLGEKN